MSPVDHMPRANRILLVLPSLERGGGERVLLQLARSFLEAGREVHLAVLLGGGPLRGEVPDAVVLHELIDASDAVKGFGLAWRAFPKLVCLLRAIEPPAVLSTMTGTNLLAVLARMHARVNSRLVLREAASLVNVKSSLKLSMMRWLYPRATELVAVSTGIAQELARLGATENKIHVIHNPVDTEKLQHLAATGLPLNLGDKTPYIVSVGRLAEQKDQQTLLKAYAGSPLRKSHYLVIVGEGDQRQRLKLLSHDLGIDDRLLLLGAVDNPYPVLAGASLHVLPSRWEGYPNVLLEALALGVPVVATDCPHGPRELLEDGHRGRLVPVADANALAGAMAAELAEPCSGRESVLASHQPWTIASRYLSLLDGP
jgi:glycosyltransferase involved in cell wall biosynthesis